MNFNSIIVIIGILVVVIAIYLIIRSNNVNSGNNVDEFDITSFKGIDELSINTNNEKLQDQELLTRMDIAEGDIIKLRKDLKQLMAVYNQAKEAAVALAPPKDEVMAESFSQSLNYNLFLQRNSDIIHLYKEGNKAEDIAKNLNKSIREVEMVVKLIK